MLRLSRGTYQQGEALRVSALTQTFRCTRADEASAEALLLKQLLPQFAEDPAVVRRWLQKAEQNEQLPPAVSVRVSDWGATPQGVFTVVSQCHGVSLKTLLAEHQRGRAFPFELGVQIACGVLACLGPAHAQEPPLPHLDLSPESVFITGDGDVVLTEFGFWDALGPALASRLRFDRGSIHRVAPELGSATPADARSDVFAAGVLLFEILTGRHPSPEASQLHTALAMAEGRREPSKQQAPQLPDRVCDALDIMLASSPAERFQSAQAARSALESLFPSAGALRPVLAKLAKLSGAPPTPQPHQAHKSERPRSTVAVFSDALGGARVDRRTPDAVHTKHAEPVRPELVEPAPLHFALMPPPLLTAVEPLSPAALTGASVLASGSASPFAPPSSASDVPRSGVTTFLKRHVVPSRGGALSAPSMASAVSHAGAQAPAFFPAPAMHAFATAAEPAGSLGAYDVAASADQSHVRAREDRSAQWSEPSKTLFQVKTYRSTDTERPEARTPAALVIGVAVMFGFAVCVGLYFVVRLVLT